MSTPPGQPPALRLFVFPASRFVNSIGATRAATDLLSAQVPSAGQVEADFVAEAEYMLPNYSRDKHVAAASLIHRAVHDFQDAQRALKVKTEDKVEEAYQASFGHLTARLEELTGDPTAEHRYQHVWERIATRPSTDKLLGAALLTQAVSEFEVLVGRLVRGLLEANPNVLLGADQKFSLRELQDFNTIEELRKSLAEDVADRLLRKGFSGWMTWFEAQLKIDVPGLFSASDEINEVLQRRHLMVHNGGIVNDAYLSNLGSTGSLPASGTKLTVTRDYLARAVDLLEASGVKLAAAAALKFSTVERERSAAEEVLDRMCFEALQRERWAVVRDISEWLIPLVRDNPAKLRLQVNNWVSRKALDGRESIEAEVRSWDTRSLGDQYKLAKLALMNDFQPALELIETMLGAKTLSESGWRTWPVLAEVRTHARETNAGPRLQGEWDTAHAH